MASCTQIETLVQAGVDGELGRAEQVILEQHLSECKVCAALLRRQQRTAALLFETLAPHRLGRSLRQSVMEHLPEMAPLRIDVEGVNWRVGAARRGVGRRYHVLAIAAAVVLVLLPILYFNWPKASTDTPPVGMVTQVAGAVGADFGGRSGAATMASYVACGSRFETAPDASAILALRGPTSVKLAGKTRVIIHDDREVTVSEGMAWFDVGKDGRLFAVNTPSGRLTVHGTTFVVEVTPTSTVVSLISGALEAKGAHSRLWIKPGDEATMAIDAAAIKCRQADVQMASLWAESMVSDASAYERFSREIQHNTPAELPADQVFVVVAGDGRGGSRAISSLFLNWVVAPSGAAAPCAYTVHVYDASMVELFHARVEGSVFAEKGRSACEVKVPGGPIRNAEVIHIKLVPDLSPGTSRTAFTKVSALSL